jgi:sugar O-acyltransferase (sialic acid O-acetyltransferase NeuD family)
MEKVIIFGNGQVAAAAFSFLSHDPAYEVVAFTVDRKYILENPFFGRPVLPFEEIERLLPPAGHRMQVAISFRQVNRLRAEKYEQAKAKGYRLITTISPRASVSPDASLGDNCRVGALCAIGPFVTVGNDVTIASGCTIGHHTTIGDHCFLAAGVTVSGSSEIGPYCFLGSGSVIRDRLVVGRETVVGAGAVLLEDAAPRSVFIARAAELLPITSDKLPLG